jgi:hypothetical protein
MTEKSDLVTHAVVETLIRMGIEGLVSSESCGSEDTSVYVAAFNCSTRVTLILCILYATQ